MVVILDRFRSFSDALHLELITNAIGDVVLMWIVIYTADVMMESWLMTWLMMVLSIWIYENDE